MNTKLLASIAIFALLAGVISTSMHSAYAEDAKKDAMAAKKDAKKDAMAAKKDAKKDAMAAKKDAKKDAMAAKKDAKKDAMAAKKDAKKDAMAAKKDAKKDAMAAKKDAKKDAMAAKKDAKKDAMAAKKPEMAGTASSSGVTVDMAKGTATNTECADQCYMPSKVNVAIGSTVTWKNVDTAAHTVTDTNGAFDSSLVNAKGSWKHKFDTAGTYNYMCIVHPWMQGTVTVS